MMQCLSFKPSNSTSLPNSPAITTNFPNPPQPSQGNSTDGTPRSSTTQPSPTVNLTREYTLAVQTNSYNEMWSRIHVDEVHEDEDAQRMFLTQLVLQPNRECVDEALRHARPNPLTRLVSSYFDHSENTTHLCLLLQQSVYSARSLYDPLYNLIEVLPHDLDSLTDSQCDCAFDVFLQFDQLDNPFPSPDSPNFHDMRSCFLQLKQQLDRRLCKSLSRVRLVRKATAASALCVVGSVVAVAVSAAVIATHALVAIVAIPLCTVAHLPRKLTKKELARAKQLEAAARGTYLLNKDLDTIDRLVARLYTAVEADKQLIRLGLERGKNKHPILEVLKRLRRDHPNFILKLKDLEEHICLCFSAVNRARSVLLREVHLHQTSSS